MEQRSIDDANFDPDCSIPPHHVSRINLLLSRYSRALISVRRLVADESTDLAIRLGQFHGLDSASFPLPDVPEPTRSHWLRMWKSIEFLHHVGYSYKPERQKRLLTYGKWLQLSGHGITGIINETGYIINIMVKLPVRLASSSSRSNIRAPGTTLDFRRMSQQPPHPNEH